MGKRIEEPDFFTREPDTVAKDLLGKYVCVKGEKEKYLIFETEAYDHNEIGTDSKRICYGADKKKEEAKGDVTAPLFEQPGTWCVYGGQLLLSVKDDKYSDNVLIKRVKNEAGEILKPDDMAKKLHLYKTKPDYCKCHGQHFLSTESNIYLANGQEAEFESNERVRVKSSSKLRFTISE